MEGGGAIILENCTSRFEVKTKYRRHIGEYAYACFMVTL